MITFGRNKKRIATISPIEKLPGATRKLGLLERPNSKFKIAKNFKMTDEELLNL